MNPVLQTPHYKRVRRMMKGIPGQATPDRPGMPDEKTRLLRAQLTLEECLEKITDGMGVDIFVKEPVIFTGGRIRLDFSRLEFEIAHNRQPDLVQWMDGCADVSVVNTGDMIACGVPDVPLLGMVDHNNLEKIEKGTISPEGKLIKPVGHKPPDVGGLLKLLTAEADAEFAQKAAEEFGTGLIPPLDTGIELTSEDGDEGLIYSGRDSGLRRVSPDQIRMTTENDPIPQDERDFLTRRQPEAAACDPTQPDCEACQ